MSLVIGLDGLDAWVQTSRNVMRNPEEFEQLLHMIDDLKVGVLSKNSVLPRVPVGKQIYIYI